VEIRGEGLRFAQQTLGNQLALNHRIRVGSLIRVYKNDKDYWEITQLPQIESAFVSANPKDGAIYALVGGFDFYNNQFNHVTQAWRQPGSSFKPLFIRLHWKKASPRLPSLTMRRWSSTSRKPVKSCGNRRTSRGI